MNILVVEGHVKLRHNLSKVLKTYFQASNPKIVQSGYLDEAAGILAAPGQEWDLVICAETVSDINGEEAGNGFELMRKFAAGNPRYKMIILTKNDLPRELGFNTVRYTLNISEMPEKLQALLHKLYSI